MYTSGQHTTAILIFALSSQEELKRKKIKNGDHLFGVLSEHSLKIAAKSRLPYYHYTEKEQEGNSFGERFTNAIQAVFNKGYKQIITIGNDSPQLKTSHIRQAAMLLTDNNSVLGPTADGGFYLMGIHRENFVASEFKDLPWQTSILATQLKKEFANTSYEFVLLNRLFDIDNSQDLYFVSKFINQLTSNIKKIINSLIVTTSVIFKKEVLFYGSYQSKIHHNKGSPLFPLA